MASERGLAVVTGASTGIGYELAKCCAEDGYELLIAANETGIEKAADELRAIGARVDAIQADLSTAEGIDALVNAIGSRPVEALLANAGRGLGQAFLDQDLREIRHVIDTNVTGTIMLIHKVGRSMRQRDRGHILLTGSIAGFVPGSYHAVYNATKAFIDSFSWALRNELKDTHVSVTCLMPGLTDTEFFERAGLENTSVGADPDKDDPAMVARIGYKAMRNGEGGVITGFSNKIQAAMAHLMPAGILAEQHRKMAEPGTADR